MTNEPRLDPAVRWALVGAAISIGAGAFGAHGLEGRLDARGLELWETAARYGMYSSILFGIVAMTRVAGARNSHRLKAALGLLLIGGLVFSTTVAALALGGPSWLGAITPLGGLSLIVGCLVGFWALGA